MNALLDVHELSVCFRTVEGELTAVDKVSFHVNTQETVALVGESGCGKSVTAMALLRLLPPDLSRIMGEITFQNRSVTTLDEPGMRALRGRYISMIFQEPMTSLNPVLTIEDQLNEMLVLHTALDATARHVRCLELLQRVRIPDASQVLAEYPHRLSGGMRQRVMIAMAVACGPALLIADEPTTALDVTIQAQVLRVLQDLKQQLGMSVLLITHDLGVVAEQADRVCVMYAGCLVETAPVQVLFQNPLHPYTQGLMAASPRTDSDDNYTTTRLSEIPGNVPSLNRLPAGCPFAPRCTRDTPQCHAARPALRYISADRAVACFNSGIDSGAANRVAFQR